MAANTDSSVRLNIDEILENRIKKELHNVVEKRLNSNNFNLLIEPGSNKGDNFMGEIHRILYRDKNSIGDTHDSLILKIAPSNLARREKFRLQNLFQREIIIYNQVLSYFCEFQRSKGIVPAKNGFSECVKCFSSINEEPCESLFLEDLKQKGLEMVNQRIPLSCATRDHVPLAMKAIGKYHAISFAIKDQQTVKFKELSSQLVEQFWPPFKSELRGHYEKMFNRLTTILKEMNRSDLLNKLKRATNAGLIETVYKLVSSAAAEPYAVICHGDLTVNNCMFRKNAAGKVLEIKVFDFRFARFSSPVTDLIVYLLCCTTKELRDNHYDDFLKIYHASLSDLLLRLGSDPNKLFPYEALLDQLKMFGNYATFVSALLLPMLVADVDTMPDFNEVFETADAENTEDENTMFRISDASKAEYNERVVNLFDDMARFVYI